MTTVYGTAKKPAAPAPNLRAGAATDAQAVPAPPARRGGRQRVDGDGVRDGEEARGTGAEHQRRDGDERVGGVEVTAEQEPGDPGAEVGPAGPPPAGRSGAPSRRP